MPFLVVISNKSLITPTSLPSNHTQVPALALLLLCGELRVKGLKKLLLLPNDAPTPISVAALEGGGGGVKPISVADLERGEEEEEGGSDDDDEEEEEDDEEEGSEDEGEEEDEEAWLGEEALLTLDGWATLRAPKEVALQLQVSVVE